MLSTHGHPDEPIDLAFCQRQLRAIPYQGTGHRGIGLMHHPELRVVLVGLAEGGRMERHSAEGRVTIHLLSGQVRVRTDRGITTLSSGQMLSLPPGKPHDVEGLYESTLLMSVVPSFESPRR